MLAFLGLGAARRAAVAAVTTIGLIAFAAPQAAAAAPQVTLVMARHESPGGLAHAIVTVWDAPAGYDITLGIQGPGASSAACPGAQWTNASARSTSRVCYVQLPTTAGTYSVRGRATLTRSGSPTVVVESAPRSIEAKGGPSPTAMTLARVAEIERCGNPTDDVWLTFDDSLNGWKVPAVMDILRRNSVRGRFFLTGQWLEQHPQNMDLILDHGHLMANHSYSHVALNTASDAEVLRQIDRGIAATTVPKLLRPPYGAGAFTTRLENLAAQRGYELCRWTVDTYDWDAEPAATMIERVSVGDYRSPPIAAGGVILMHGHGEHMIEALQGIIDAVRGKGLTLDPLGPPPTIRRPDASIALVQAGPYAVDDYYHHVANKKQTRRRDGVPAASTQSYFVRLQNDGSAVDGLTVQASESGSARMQVTYWVGGVDVTAAVRGSGYTLSGLAPGSSAEMVVRIRIGRRAPVGALRRSVIAVRSAALPARVDVVQAIARR